MKMALVDRIPFKKIVAVLAICVGVSFGLCSVGAAIGGGMDRFGSSTGNVVVSLFVIPGGVLFWTSLLGLLLLFPLWLVLSIVKKISKRSGHT